MKVSEIMTQNVLAVAPETPVSEVAHVLVENGISGVPVVDAERHLVGIITEADLIVQHARLHFPRVIKLLESVLVLGGVGHFEEELRRALATTAGELMTPDPLTVDPETDVADLAALMFDRRVNPVPVVEGGRVVGVVSRADLVRLMVRRSDEAEQTEEAPEA